VNDFDFYMPPYHFEVQGFTGFRSTHFSPSNNKSLKAYFPTPNPEPPKIERSLHSLAMTAAKTVAQPRRTRIEDLWS
jgi:hypothetical protein